MIISYSFPPNPARVLQTEASQVTLGRYSPSQSVDLDLNPDLQVSHRHARITCDDGEYWVEDLGSRNGTWLNGERITARCRITPDDTLLVGQTTLTLQPEGPVVTEEHPTVEPGGVPEAHDEEGVFASRLVAVESPSMLMVPPVAEDEPSQETSTEAARHRLTAFLDLVTALGTISQLEPMLQTIIRHLVDAIPAAHRAALLRREGDRLLLQAHLPAGNPSASLSLAHQAMERREGFVWQIGKQAMWGDPSSSIIHFGTQCAMYAPMVHQDEVLGVVCVDNAMDANAFNEDDLRLLMAMANHAAMCIKNHMLQQELQRETNLRNQLQRQVSPQVADLLMKEMKEGRGKLRSQAGELADPVTILVSDVRGFTASTVNQDPEDLFQRVKAMFEVLTPIIFKYDGTVDKYMGDGMLAYFGSPVPDDHQQEKAVRAAIEMQEAMRKLVELWNLRPGRAPAWQLGIGVHTGEVVQGLLGILEDKYEWTVIGADVNLAARYCDGAGPGEILISRSVYQDVYRLVDVMPKTIATKHPETEPDLEGFVVTGLRLADRTPDTNVTP